MKNRLSPRRKSLWLHVEKTAFHYARRHGLRLEKLRPLTSYERSRYHGLCFRDGVVAVDVWGIEPYRVLQIIAHELAHLAHWNHDARWMRLFAEIMQDMVSNRELDNLETVCEAPPT